MRSGLDFDGDFHEDNTKYEDGITLEQMKVMQKEYYARAQKEEADREELKRKNYFGLVTDAPFDSAAYRAETDRQRQEFEAFARERDRKERDRIEHENALAFVKATPRYIQNEQNSNNIRAFLKEKGLAATPTNLQKAYQHLQPILELRPEPITPPKTYTIDELYKMPLQNEEDWSLTDNSDITTLEQLARANAARNSKLDGEL